MKTFAETMGKTPFNWMKFLNQEEFEFTEKELRDAEELATVSWVTCACGNLCDAIPRRTPEEEEEKRLNGEIFQKPYAPKDEKLIQLGVEFADRFEEMLSSFERDDMETFHSEQRYAIDTLIAIETRSTEILKEMGVIP